MRQDHECLRLDLRAQLLERLESDARLDHYARRLKKCGQPLTLVCANCNWTERHVYTRCDWKCCPSCQHALATRTAKRFEKIAARAQWPLFVTFTSTHTAADGADWWRTFRKAHSKLRAQRWWKKCVSGGVIAYEVSRLNTHERKRYRLRSGDAGWHFHGHALLDCKWLSITQGAPPIGCTKEEFKRRAKIACDEVGSCWSLALGRKGSVKVRRVWKDGAGISAAVVEVLKYSVKGSDLADTEHDIKPVLDAMEKTRLITAFGDWWGIPEAKRPRAIPSACECGAQCWMPAFCMTKC